MDLLKIIMIELYLGVNIVGYFGVNICKTLKSLNILPKKWSPVSNGLCVPTCRSDKK